MCSIKQERCRESYEDSPMIIMLPKEYFDELAKY